MKTNFVRFMFKPGYFPSRILNPMVYKTRHPVKKTLVYIIMPILLLFTMSCSKTLRMQAKFDNEPLNALPASQPLPSPPLDLFTWGAIDITARIAQGSNGSQQVLVTPTPDYFNTGKYRAFVLQAFSEALTPGQKPGVRGGLTVNMHGTGKMVISFRTAQGTNLQGDPLGGYMFINNGIPSIGYMTTQNLKVMQLNNIILNSTMLSPYVSGQSVELRWSIDQDSRIMSLGATPFGGTPNNASVTFDQVAADGTQNTPIQKIWITIEFFEVARGIQVFFDDFYVEEY